MSEKNSKAKRGQQVPPFPCGQFFQVHGSKLKLHPVCDLGQASVLRITHRVFFLGVREDPFNGLFAPLVKLPVLRRISGIVRQFLIVLPDMPLHRFDTVPGMRTPCFFLRASFFLEVLSLCFLGDAGGSLSSSKGFLPCASLSALTSSINSFA